MNLSISESPEVFDLLSEERIASYILKSGWTVLGGRSFEDRTFGLGAHCAM